MDVAIALVKGSFVYACQPGNHNETSLAITFAKFATVLRHHHHHHASMSTTTKTSGTSTTGSLTNLFLYDRPFYQCLVTAILRHKTKLPKEARETIVKEWFLWLRSSSSGNNKVDDVDDDHEYSNTNNGSMTSPAHEYLLYLLNEWHIISNALLPRDKLLEYSITAVQAATTSETKVERKFHSLWNYTTGSNDSTMTTSMMKEFVLVKAQYERMLKSMPETMVQHFKEQTGILAIDADEDIDEDVVIIEKDDEN